jgi:rubrerythrin
VRWHDDESAICTAAERTFNSGADSMQDHSDHSHPVDNQTYNLLQILTSKLEAVEAYEIYEEDLDEQAAGVLQEIAKDDRRHVSMLLRLLGIASSASKGAR